MTGTTDSFGTSYSHINTYTEYMQFYIGRDGRCYNVRTNHKKTSPWAVFWGILGGAGAIMLIGLAASGT